VVKVADWLNSFGQKRPKEPWQTIIAECKYRSLKSDEATWLRRFWAFDDKTPKSIDKNLVTPVMLFPSGWGLARLSHFYRVYRAVFASTSRGSDWLAQLAKFFYIQSLQYSSPEYFDEWMDGVGDIKTEIYGPTLPIVVMGSSIKRHGPGGGRVVLFNLTRGVR
jgi:hypothetical protein